MKHIDLTLDGQSFTYCLLLTVAFALHGCATTQAPPRRRNPLDEPHEAPGGRFSITRSAAETWLMRRATIAASARP